MQWLRLYHDTPNDPKWRLVARKSGQPVGNVLAVWTCMMVHASESEERGTLVGWDDEIAAAVLEYPIEAVMAIREAMQGRVLDGNRLTGWEKRQRASDDVAERVKKHRKTKENPPEGGNSGPNGGQTTSPDPKPNGSYSNAGVTLHPVTDSLPPLRAQTPDSQIEDSKTDPSPHVDSYPARGRVARLVGAVGKLTGIPDTEKNRAIAEGWLRKGWDAERDILPAIGGVVSTTSYPLEQIRGFGFFTDAIDAFHARRLNPLPVLPRLSVVPSTSKRRESGAQEIVDLHAALKAGLS